mmetsp:Transcript_14700/g.32438  ORF Transcript_14700/g.32438 Transcript_14700/m.32438 type:complete len:341 (+) Transcript_14700:93-1115(+)
MLATLRQQSPSGPAFGSPVSAKLSWADLCEDSDSNEWEEEDVASRATTPKSQDSAWLGRTDSNISTNSNISNTTCNSFNSYNSFNSFSSNNYDTATDSMNNIPFGAGVGAGRGSKQRGSRGGQVSSQQQQHQQLRCQQQLHQSQRTGQKRWSNNNSIKGCSNPQPAGAATVALEPQQQQTWPMAGFNMVPADFATGSYSVVLEGVPLNLCNEVCLEAMLHQAGLQGTISKFDIEKDASNAASGGTATITLCNWQAAMRCYNHFATSRWSSGSLKAWMPMAKQQYTQSQDGSDMNHYPTNFIVCAAVPYSVVGMGHPHVPQTFVASAVEGDNTQSGSYSQA